MELFEQQQSNLQEASTKDLLVKLAPLCLPSVFCIDNYAPPDLRHQGISTKKN